jgi:hypothetical protein
MLIETQEPSSGNDLTGAAVNWMIAHEGISKFDSSGHVF